MSLFPNLHFANRDNCILCNKDSNTFVHLIRSYDFESGIGEFDILYCPHCKIGYTNPYPTEDTSWQLYEQKTSSDFDIIQKSYIDGIKDFLARRQWRKLASYLDHEVNRVLDYGCGNGRFASTALEVFHNARAYGVDYQDKPPAIFNESYNNKLHYYTIDEFNRAKEKYDIIFLRHVLEHTYHPVELLQLLADRLQENGVLYIEVPNLKAGCARVLGRKWLGYYLPRHIFHYTPESLFSVVSKAGLYGRVERNEMPLMGNIIANLLNLNKANWMVQSTGIFLHPMQVLVEMFF